MNKKRFHIGEFVSGLRNANKLERFCIFICGVLIYSIAFSVFFSPRNVVTGGTTGLSILIHDVFGIDTSITVFVTSFLLLIVGCFLLGKDVAMKTILGVILLPIFMEFGEFYLRFLRFEESSLFLMVFFGGITMGFGNGLIIRSGYSVGGFQTLYQILYKYFGISIGKSTLILNGILILISSSFFGLSIALYAIIGLYISSVITDKVMLETSATKTFYIVTDKSKEISEYVFDVLGYGVTEIDARGGYSNQYKKVLMCAVPTREYYQMKEVIQDIDENVFFLITDTYEIYSKNF